MCANAEEFDSPDFRSNRLIEWGTGRGGFLADDMPALHDAAARLQVPSHISPQSNQPEDSEVAEARIAFWDATKATTFSTPARRMEMKH